MESESWERAALAIRCGDNGRVRSGDEWDTADQ
jgi:hypothetical protein